MIELQNVIKRFGTKTAVNDVSFEVRKGEIVGFLGPNGAGKTTTMRIITGFFPPTEGKVKVAGNDVVNEPVKAKEKIGYMPENVPLYKELQVEEYLKFIAEIKGVQKDMVATRVTKAMEESGTANVRKMIIGKLSKGYRQRVGLAQAILNDPEVLILDEPTVGLDPKQIKEIRNLIKNMKGERTIILSTHILPEVNMTCDRVIVINEGQIVAQDRVENLTKTFQKSGRIYVQVEAPKAQFEQEIEKINGVTSITEAEKLESGVYSYNIDTEEGADLRKEIVNRIVKKDWGLLELKKVDLTLEEVFLKLVTKEVI